MVNPENPPWLAEIEPRIRARRRDLLAHPLCSSRLVHGFEWQLLAGCPEFAGTDPHEEAFQTNVGGENVIPVRSALAMPRLGLRH